MEFADCYKSTLNKTYLIASDITDLNMIEHFTW